MYPYATLEDGTEIVHSGLLGNGIVTVYCERPDPVICFRTAEFALPGCMHLAIYGFPKDELQALERFVRERESDILMRATATTAGKLAREQLEEHEP